MRPEKCLYSPFCAKARVFRRASERSTLEKMRSKMLEVRILEEKGESFDVMHFWDTRTPETQ